MFRGASTQKDMEATLLRAPEKSCTRRPHLQPRCCLCTPDPLTHCLPDFFWGALQGTSSPLCPHLCYSANLALSWHSLTSISQFKPDSSPPGTSLPPSPDPTLFQVLERSLLRGPVLTLLLLPLLSSLLGIPGAHLQPSPPPPHSLLCSCRVWPNRTSDHGSPAPNPPRLPQQGPKVLSPSALFTFSGSAFLCSLLQPHPLTCRP